MPSCNQALARSVTIGPDDLLLGIENTQQRVSQSDRTTDRGSHCNDFAGSVRFVSSSFRNSEAYSIHTVTRQRSRPFTLDKIYWMHGKHHTPTIQCIVVGILTLTCLFNIDLRVKRV